MFRLGFVSARKIVRAACYYHRTKMVPFSLNAYIFESDPKASCRVDQIGSNGDDPVSAFPFELYFNFFHINILLLLRHPGFYSYPRLRAGGHSVRFYRLF